MNQNMMLRWIVAICNVLGFASAFAAEQGPDRIVSVEARRSIQLSGGSAILFSENGTVVYQRILRNRKPGEGLVEKRYVMKNAVNLDWQELLKKFAFSEMMKAKEGRELGHAGESEVTLILRYADGTEKRRSGWSDDPAMEVWRFMRGKSLELADGYLPQLLKFEKQNFGRLQRYATHAVGEDGAPKWTYQSEEGEDATSTHYYFYRAKGERVDRVRWVWNGGAQNAPTVTDYSIEKGKITIRHLEGERKSIPALIAGRDAELKLTREHSIESRNIGERMLEAGFEKPLTKRQRTDLTNLQQLLVEYRKGNPEAAKKDADGGSR